MKPCLNIMCLIWKMKINQIINDAIKFIAMPNPKGFNFNSK